MTFPNHSVVQRGNVMLRTSRLRQPLRLRPGEDLERTFDLIQTFPDLALSTGDFEFAYEIGDDPRVTKSAPTRLRIESGPDAVANLFGWLANDDLAVRESASFLLHRMTAYIAGYSAEDDATARQAAIARWQGWWQTIGRALPWSFTTPGAVLDGARLALPRVAVANPALEVALQPVVSFFAIGKRKKTRGTPPSSSTPPASPAG